MSSGVFSRNKVWGRLGQGLRQVPWRVPERFLNGRGKVPGPVRDGVRAGSGKSGQVLRGGSGASSGAGLVSGAG